MKCRTKYKIIHLFGHLQKKPLSCTISFIYHFPINFYPFSFTHYRYAMCVCLRCVCLLACADKRKKYEVKMKKMKKRRAIIFLWPSMLNRSTEQANVRWNCRYTYTLQRDVPGPHHTPHTSHLFGCGLFLPLALFRYVSFTCFVDRGRCSAPLTSHPATPPFHPPDQNYIVSVTT